MKINKWRLLIAVALLVLIMAPAAWSNPNAFNSNLNRIGNNGFINGPNTFHCGQRGFCNWNSSRQCNMQTGICNQQRGGNQRWGANRWGFNRFGGCTSFDQTYNIPCGRNGINNNGGIGGGGVFGP